MCSYIAPEYFKGLSQFGVIHYNIVLCIIFASTHTIFVSMQDYLVYKHDH